MDRVVETYLDVPEDKIFTFTNSQGNERKVIAFGSVFICIHCFGRFGVTVMHSPEHRGQLQIYEWHYPECEYLT